MYIAMALILLAAALLLLRRPSQTLIPPVLGPWTSRSELNSNSERCS